MNIDELRKMSEADLQSRANSHLEHLDFENESNMEKQHYVVQAQLYLAELERRQEERERAKSEKIAHRDYKLEIWVIVLIGAELLIAIVAIIVGSIEGNKQMKVLEQLNHNSAATAAILAKVQETQDSSLEKQQRTLENIVAMNDSLQKQMDFNFTDALVWNGSSSDGKFEIYNRSKTTLFLWGSTLNGQAKAIEHYATPIQLGSIHTFDILQPADKLAWKADGEVKNVPFTMYLKTEDGTKYIARATISITRNKASTMTACGVIVITREVW